MAYSKAIEKKALSNATGKDGKTTSLQILDSAKKRAGTTNEAYNNVVQQRTLLDTQVQAANATFNNTLGTTQENIYQAQRQAKARQAALGYVGQLAVAQTNSDLQRQVNTELSNLLNQAETGAINIAGQQSQLNQAEIAALTNEIAASYTEDYAINNGLVNQDNAKYATNILLGILGGATVGGFGGGMVSSGLKSASLWKTATGLGTLLGGGGFAAGSLLQNSDALGTTDANGQQLGLILGLTGLGTTAGLTGLGSLAKSGAKGTGWISKIINGVRTGAAKNAAGAVIRDAQGNVIKQVGNKLIGSAASQASRAGSGWLSKITGTLTKGGALPWITAAVGATVGGALAARKVPYLADRKAIENDAIAKDFNNMGFSFDTFYDYGDNYTKQVW